MEEDIKRVYETFSKVVGTVKDLDIKVQKQEKILLATFSYLYNRLDDISHEIEHYDDSHLIKEIDDIKGRFIILEETLREKNEATKNEELQEIEENVAKVEQKPKKIKRHRPWHYFFTKHQKYKKLLNQKLILEKEIDERAEIRRKELEEQRRLDEEVRKRLAEEERKRALQRRKDAQRKSAEILKNLYKQQ